MSSSCDICLYLQAFLGSELFLIDENYDNW